MPPWSRLLIPLGLGIAAGLINWKVLTRGEVHKYVIAAAPIKAGDMLDSANTAFREFPVRISIGIPENGAATILNRPASRAYEKDDLLLRQDMLVDQSLDLKQGEIAVNVSLDGVQYEASLLRVGSSIGFVVPSENSESINEDSAFEVLGPYRLVSIGSTTTASQTTDGTRSTTISVAVDFNSDNKALSDSGDRLVRARLDRQIAALAFYH